MKFILGTKKGMTQIFAEDGRVYPATVVSAGPVFVTAVKTKEKDGYDSVQVGYQDQKKERLSKALLGHLKDKPMKILKEFRTESDVKVGDEISVDIFEEGDKVVVSGTTKGKGFQGVVKRHGFSGGPRTHGQKHNERTGGSIGAMGPARVFKGVKMPGRMGSDRKTIKGLKVLKVMKDENKIFISGAIPGKNGSLVEIVSN